MFGYSLQLSRSGILLKCFAEDGSLCARNRVTEITEHFAESVAKLARRVVVDDGAFGSEAFPSRSLSDICCGLDARKGKECGLQWEGLD